MSPELRARIYADVHHDDGVNAWSMTRLRVAPNLCGLIAGYCDYSERTQGFSTRRELPHAEGVLIINLGEPVFIVGGNGREITLRSGEGFVAGVHLRPALSRSSGAQRGVQVELPLSTLRRLLGLPMHELIDRVIPLHDLLGRRGDAMTVALADADSLETRISLLESALMQRVTETGALDRRQLQALHLLRTRSDLDISAVGDVIGYSRKHLADRVRDAVGVGPRSYRRLLRFQGLMRSLTHQAAPDWATLAQRAGYFDQSHLIREFGEFAGMTPTEFMARSLQDGGGLVET
jgi:AraC-like DNA-binding protein